jgi:hypothetical protein
MRHFRARFSHPPRCHRKRLIHKRSGNSRCEPVADPPANSAGRPLQPDLPRLAPPGIAALATDIFAVPVLVAIASSYGIAAVCAAPQRLQLDTPCPPGETDLAEILVIEVLPPRGLRNVRTARAAFQVFCLIRRHTLTAFRMPREGQLSLRVSLRDVRPIIAMQTRASLRWVIHPITLLIFGKRTRREVQLNYLCGEVLPHRK